MAAPRLCSIPNCDKPGRARGWCDAHYWRWRKNGDPLSGRTPEGEPLRFLMDVVLPYEGEDCLIWPYSRSSKGYGSVKVDGKREIVSRLVCKEVNGPPPSIAHVAAHGCGNGYGGCVNPKHMRWATPQENADDTVRHGKTTRGEGSASARLSEEDVLKIHSLKGKMSLVAIGKMFGVGAPHICRILKGDKWAYLTS